jgi:uncharacterized protein (TIGR03067 family)
MRTTLLVLAVSAALAFAPAPFPKPSRHATDQDDLKKLQGEWYRVEYDGRPERPPLHVRIVNDRLEFISSSGAYVISVDPRKRPKRIDIRNGPDEQPPSYRGVYRLDGDTFTYCLRSNVTEADRPLHFDTGRQGAWTAVYKRSKP